VTETGDIIDGGAAMAVDRSYVAKNDVERARLTRFVDKCSDADLARALPAGWTVAAVLGHVAFWDQRILTLLDAWDRGTPPSSIHGEDVDWTNDAGKPFLLALPPRALAQMAVAIADAVDRRVAGLSDDRVAKNTAAGSPLSLDRAEHRKEHLDEIERVLRG
jgi:Mycothiol maleylpyruvate isomerase N-terminal domain